MEDGRSCVGAAGASPPVLSGTRLLVVGGSAGIGRGIVLAAAKAGANIVVVGRDQRKLDDVVAKAVEDLTTNAGTIAAIATDVSDTQRCRDMVGYAAERMGGLDVVVVASALSSLALLDDETSERWRDLFATNVVGPSTITSAALEYVRPPGLMMYLSSTSSTPAGETPPALGAYAVSKAALNRSIDIWRVEHPDRRFCCLRVGDTGGTDVARNFDPALARNMFGTWLKKGLISSTVMDPGDLGAAIVEAIALLLAHPSITIPDLVIQPVGGAMRPEDLDKLLGNVSMSHSRENDSHTAEMANADD